MTTDPRDIVFGILVSGAFIAVPLLSTFAFHEWHRHIRTELPRWRNALGGAAVCLIILGWFSYGLLFIASRSRFSRHDIFDVGFSVVGLLALGGMSLAPAWTGKARSRALTAGCLLAAIWASFLLTPQ